MLDLFSGSFFCFLQAKKKSSKFFIFFVDFLAIDMVLSYNGMVVKIIFLPPSHYKVNITLFSDKSKEPQKKKSIFF